MINIELGHYLALGGIIFLLGIFAFTLIALMIFPSSNISILEESILISSDITFFPRRKIIIEINNIVLQFI